MFTRGSQGEVIILFPFKINSDKRHLHKGCRSKDMSVILLNKIIIIVLPTWWCLSWFRIYSGDADSNGQWFIVPLDKRSGDAKFAIFISAVREATVVKLFTLSNSGEKSNGQVLNIARNETEVILSEMRPDFISIETAMDPYAGVNSLHYSKPIGGSQGLKKF